VTGRSAASPTCREDRSVLTLVANEPTGTSCLAERLATSSRPSRAGRTVCMTRASWRIFGAPALVHSRLAGAWEAEVMRRTMQAAVALCLTVVSLGVSAAPRSGDDGTLHVAIFRFRGHEPGLWMH
jgi:hypothetical protein